jgi:hypothetical protein
VVPDQTELAPLGDEASALVGLGPVADDIAEAPAALDARLVDRGEHRLEGRQVAVDVGEDGDSHGGGMG